MIASAARRRQASWYFAAALGTLAWHPERALHNGKGHFQPTMLNRRITSILALALSLAAPNFAAIAVAAPVTEVGFQTDRQTLSVPLGAGGVPAMVELANPPRLVVDLPGTALAIGQDMVYPVGRVSRMVVEHVGSRSRVTLYLRQPVRGAWSLGFQQGRLLISLPQLRGSAAQTPPAPLPKSTLMPGVSATPKPIVKASPKPAIKASPKPKPSLRPIGKPRPRPTPMAIVAPTARPSRAPATPLPNPPSLSTAPSKAPTVATSKPSAVPFVPASAAPPASSAPIVASVKPTAAATAMPSPMATQPMPVATPTATVGASVIQILPVKPAQGDYAKFTAITYDEDVRFMQFSLSRKVTPSFSMEGHRLIVDLPGTVIGETQTRQFTGALVQQAIAYQHTPTETRVVILFARGIGKAWGLKQSGGNIVLVFDHKPVNAPSIEEPTMSAKPTPKPSLKPMLKATPKPVAKPTAKPIVKPTPKPKPSSTATPKPANPQGANSFSGTVFHINTGEPIAGVRVTIGGHPAVTDTAGRFAVQGLPAGRLQVVVTAAGFASQTFDILVPEDKSLSLNLVPALH
jgi:hypothetical protein